MLSGVSLIIVPPQSFKLNVCSRCFGSPQYFVVTAVEFGRDVTVKGQGSLKVINFLET